MKKTAVVTGASSGIGEATARRLAAEGYDVVAGARRQDRLDKLAAEVPGIRPVSLDVTSQESVDALAASLDRCDVLVNNAGGALGMEPVAEGRLDDWQRMYDTNVLGSLRMTQALVPMLVESGDGVLVMLTSTAGLVAYEGGGGYVAAKQAQRSMAETLRLELVGQPVRVVEIAPGMVQSEGPGYAFTPDNRALVLAYGGKLHRVDVATGADHLIPFIAHIDQPLGPLIAPHFVINDSVIRVRGVSHPTLSPDGRQLAFSAVGKVWLMDLPNGAPHRLTATARAAGPDEFNPAWSPDGRYVAYTAWSDREGGALYRVAVTGGPAEQMTRDTARYESVAYSPDGRWLYADRVPGGATSFPYSYNDLERADAMKPPSSHQLVRVPAEGGPPTVVTRLETRRWNPTAVEPRFVDNVGDWYFMNSESVLARGSASRTLADSNESTPVLRILTRGDRGPQPDGTMFRTIGLSIVPSPDGRYAVATQFPGGLYVVRLPGPLAALPSTANPLVLRVYDAEQPSGVRIQRVRGTGGDRVEWARDGSYFVYSAGPVIVKQYVSRDTLVASMLGRAERIEVRLTLPADRPHGVIALRGARLVTMRGREVIARGDLVVRGNRIVALGPTGTVTIPPEAKVFELAGKTILPGYIDVHDHIYYTDHSILPRLPHLPGELAYGTTTLRDPLPAGNELATYHERIALGDAVGPRVFSTSQAIHPDVLWGLETVDAMRGFFKRWSEDYHSETVKFIANVGWRRRRELMAMAAQAEGLFPTNHIEGQTNMLTTLLDGYGALEHSLYDVPVYGDVAKLFAASGIVWTPTIGVEFQATTFYSRGLVPDAKLRRFTSPRRLALLFSEGEAEYVMDDAHLHHLLEVPAKIAAAGGKVGVGGHGYVIGLSPHWEMWLYVKGGMPTHDALRAGTIWSAQEIGHGDDLGSLEVGKLADLQVLDKNPLTDIRNTLSIRYVMKNGRLYDASDLTEIWPRHQPIEPFWWWGDSLRTKPRTLNMTKASAPFQLDCGRNCGWSPPPMDH